MMDIEASGLDAYLTQILLVGVKVKSNYFMFDHTADIEVITESLAKKYVVGHNLKYDIKLLKVASGILIKRLYDTMIAEQRLFMGAGYEFGYASLVERYEGEVVIKATRNEFIGADPEKFRINYNHLNYLRSDLKHLESIKKKQKVRMHKQNQQFLIYGIECALVPVIAAAELEGFVLNKEKWLNRVRKDVLERQQILGNLDTIVRGLRDTLPNVDKSLLTGGKWDKKRIRNDVVDLISPNGTTEILDLFGNPTSSVTLFSKGRPSTKGKRITKTIPKVEEYPGCIRYTKQEMVHIFGALKQVGITDIETFSIPTFFENGKLTDFNKYSVKEALLERYIVLRPQTVLKPFLEEFGKLQKVNKSLSTYGKTFIDKINTKTGRLHTNFMQCFTNTGRMSSGGGKLEPDKPNFQNLPRDPELRESFGTTEGNWINTADYSGAELVVMASHAQDFKLLELSKGDMHSHFATLGWREIYRVRANALAVKGADYIKYEEMSRTFTVTKKEPEGFRTNYKAIAFGVVYGAYGKKVAQVLNVNVKEAEGAILTVKREIPDTIKMVEERSAFAAHNGYVIHNDRTNSRRWFPALIKQLKGEFNKKDNFMDISEAESAARNSTIQGTQADFIKEASVTLQYWYWKNGYDAQILSWVHDEIVDRMPIKDSKYLSFIKREILTSVANKYLKNVTIDVEQVLLPYWTK